MAQRLKDSSRRNLSKQNKRRKSMKGLLFLTITALLLTSCGGNSTPSKPAVDYSGKLTAKIKKGGMAAEKVTELTEKKGLLESSASSVGVRSQQINVIFHKISIANYELKDASDEPTQKGQVMITFILYGDKDAKATDPIKVGEYAPFKPDFNSNEAPKANMTISDVQVITFEDAKDTKSLSQQNPRTGAVKIESVADGLVKGTIDLKELDSSVSGNFTVTSMK